jgi:ABC-type polysaccharide/polyol phosphate export permease
VTGIPAPRPVVGLLDRRAWFLIAQFAAKDFKIRYSHAVLGYVWSVLNPLLFSVIYYVVFTRFMEFQVIGYAGYLLLGMMLWNFFADGSSHGSTALLARAGIVTKIPLPRQLIVYAAVLNAFITFAINLVVLGVLLWILGMRLHWPAVTFVIAIVDIVLLTLGMSLMLAPLHVRFRDVGHLWGVMLQLGFWFTPVIYQDTMVPERWRWFIDYNPMARILAHSREALIWGTWTSLPMILTTTAFAALVMVAGTLVFRRFEARLVEYY